MIHAAVDTFGHVLDQRVIGANDQNRAQVEALAAEVHAATAQNVDIATNDQG